jgi:general stress protein 26
MIRILDGSGGDGKPLNEQDIKDFLMNKVLNVHLGTVDENGHATIHPAWYYFDYTKETIYVETGRYSKKVENLTRNDTIYFCVDDPSRSYKGVRGKGKVKVYYDINFNSLIA